MLSRRGIDPFRKPVEAVISVVGDVQRMKDSFDRILACIRVIAEQIFVTHETVCHVRITASEYLFITESPPPELLLLAL